jgi:hypothetical protein
MECETLPAWACAMGSLQMQALGDAPLLPALWREALMENKRLGKFGVACLEGCLRGIEI